MKKIPWKAITIFCLTAALLVVARCAVTVSKAIYYGQNYVTKLMDDPWFYVGILAAALGLGALAALGVQSKQNTKTE